MHWAASVPAIVSLVACTTDADKDQAKAVVLSRYPTFEADVQRIITAKYGKRIFTAQKWEWHIEPGLKRDMWRVQYGCYRHLSTTQQLMGEAVKDITGEITGGIISYNPKAEGKGIYVELAVDTKRNTMYVVP
jgi:hypothetical protein